MMINPNDESTLTSLSGSTPVPADNNVIDSDDVVLMKFAQIYAEDHSIIMNDSFSKDQSYHSDLSADFNTSGDFGDDTNNHPECFLHEVTCQNDEMSLSDKSFDAPSTISRRSSIDHVQDELLEEVDYSPQCPKTEQHAQAEFISLRITYLIVTLVIMLADGLQGTHLYVLYEGYGFSVASLYGLGFVTGGLASPITGPLVDKLGRKKSAILYCILEISINMLEQYPLLPGLIISRMVGGITTNLLSTVFDAWLDTEYRRRGLAEEKYEIIMRDSVIVSNLAAIGSGYLAHILAERYGPVGPFEGAVTFTSIALIVVIFVWTENYGCGEHHVKGMGEFLQDAVQTFKADSKILRVGVIQGLTCASIQIFIFLWSPALRHFAKSAPIGTIGIDDNGEPAYGLIFGAFMAAGVFGGLAAPFVRRFASFMLSPLVTSSSEILFVECEEQVRPMAVEALSALCYCSSALLLLAPCLLAGDGTHSFSMCLVAFLIYEFMVGLYLPCEGVIRSLYFPAEGRASIMTLPRIIVNCAVSLGVVLTTFITMRSAFLSVVVLMFVSAGLQLSLLSNSQWTTLLSRISFLLNVSPSSEASLIEEKPDLSRSSTASCEFAIASCLSDSLAANFELAGKIKCE